MLRHPDGLPAPCERGDRGPALLPARHRLHLRRRLRRRLRRGAGQLGSLARIIPWFLGAILAYTIFRPQVGAYDHPAKLHPPAFFVLAGLGLGFYDGFFGPGVGSLWTISFILVLGQNFTRATGYTKIMNATSNVASLALFIPTHRVLYGAGAAMAAGQIVGARLGSGLVVKKGARFIRPIFLTIVALTLVRLLYVAEHR